MDAGDSWLCAALVFGSLGWWFATAVALAMAITYFIVEWRKGDRW